ncbi:GIY-YIG nuclease family protein [Frankia nepalensis]|uniref:Eco29kI family restriction endonuclease n=2 Tax=Frankia nepalensis TaxID=1836974 RepID=A0A937RFH3_9ACTN|nr:Eco29kI family restriction endonuclease [Frankia nepalensis]MBL7497320.1 Eco29kI family restriction endonuclease [Frankia nepalensis]MBL7509723.1 Eco29kI family restriction endonuclease [Frankia nepalensis]MBL7629450.1 Eco29kI family restriction endonuclease [Frankia nepalensis]
MATQLAETLDHLEPVHLTTANLARLEPRPGVYELYLLGDRVYVGKADRSLPERLEKHRIKLSGRYGIDIRDVAFRCLYVEEDLEAAAPEKMLISEYRRRDPNRRIVWNTNGFGNNDPGRNRDDSLVKVAHFDAKYPIDLNASLPALGAGIREMRAYLESVKFALPFTFRYDKSPATKRDLSSSSVELRGGPLTPRELMWEAIRGLPTGWQATALPGYLILYRENRRYGSALAVWRKEDGEVAEKRLDAMYAEDGDSEGASSVYSDLQLHFEPLTLEEGTE